MNTHDLQGYRQTIISNTTLNPLQPSHALTLSSEHYNISGIGYISIVIWNDVCMMYVRILQWAEYGQQHIHYT